MLWSDALIDTVLHSLKAHPAVAAQVNAKTFLEKRYNEVCRGCRGFAAACSMLSHACWL